MNRLLIEARGQKTRVPTPPRAIEHRSDNLDQDHPILFPIAFGCRPFPKRRTLHIGCDPSEPFDQFSPGPRDLSRVPISGASDDWKEQLDEKHEPPFLALGAQDDDDQQTSSLVYPDIVLVSATQRFVPGTQC